MKILLSFISAEEPHLHPSFEVSGGDPFESASLHLRVGHPNAKFFEGNHRERDKGGKGDISNEVSKGTFLKSFDSYTFGC
jgi:hypothetical protein